MPNERRPPKNPSRRSQEIERRSREYPVSERRLGNILPCESEPDAFAELAALRQYLNLPPAGAPDDDCTLAKLVIAGQVFYGRNSGIQSPKTQITMPINIFSKSHAETECGQKALDAGMKGKAKIAFMYVDEPPCPACGNNNGIGSLAAALGLDKIVVYYPRDGKIVMEQFTPPE